MSKYFISPEGNAYIDNSKAAEVASAYTKWVLLSGEENHGRSGDIEKDAFYYSTPAGRLALERLAIYNPDYAELVRKDLHNAHLDAFDKEQLEYLKELSQTGKRMLFDTSEEPIDFLKHSQSTLPLGAYLIEQSEKWLRRVSSEEQTIIAHATGNGFYLTGESIRTEAHRSSVEDVLRNNEEDIDYIVAEYAKSGINLSEEESVAILRERALDFTETLRKTVDRAPKTEGYFRIFRGARTNEINSLIPLGLNKRERQSMSLKDFANNVLKGEYTGQLLSRESARTAYKTSKFAHSPMSASANAHRALFFAEKDRKGGSGLSFMFEFEAKTLASPVAVSQWGITEAEVLTNSNSEYMITGSYMTAQKHHENLVVIKLREIL